MLQKRIQTVDDNEGKSTHLVPCDTKHKVSS